MFVLLQSSVTDGSLWRLQPNSPTNTLSLHARNLTVGHSHASPSHPPLQHQPTPALRSLSFSLSLLWPSWTNPDVVWLLTDVHITLCTRCSSFLPSDSSLSRHLSLPQPFTSPRSWSQPLIRTGSDITVLIIRHLQLFFSRFTSPPRLQSSSVVAAVGRKFPLCLSGLSGWVLRRPPCPIPRLPFTLPVCN